MICTSVSSLESVPEGDLVELRVDLLPSIDLKAIQTFKERLSCPIIFSLKKESFKETGETRLNWINQLAALQPDYFDIEEEVPEKIIAKLHVDYPAIEWIISYHNYESMPEDLEALFQRISRHKASLYKIAVQTANQLEVVDLLLWLKASKRKNVIVIPMGTVGTAGRILAPFLGSPFTYAYNKEATASGQLSIQEMKRYFTFKNPAFYGLIGNPVTASISNITHNDVIREGNLNALYVKMDVTKEELPYFLEGAKTLGFKGLSVTMPLKEALIPYVAEISPEAKAMGAINTLVFEKEKLIGLNTDGRGTLWALKQKGSLNGKKVVVLGAGGAAKAIIHALLQEKALVTVSNRTPERGKQVAADFHIPFIPLNEIDAYLKQGYDILINCTPNPAPINPDALLKGTLVMETKTRPQNTELLLEAKKRGCHVVYGYEMFIGQAILQYEAWFKNSNLPFQSLLKSAISTHLQLPLECSKITCLKDTKQ